MSDVWDTDGRAKPRGGYGAQEDVDPPGGALPVQGGPAFSPTTQRKSSAVTLLVVAGVSSVVGIFLAIPAVILGILAVVHQGESPTRSAKFTRWGWMAYATGMTLTVLAGAALIAVAVYAASGND